MEEINTADKKNNETELYVCPDCSTKAVVMERDGLVCKNCGWGKCTTCS